MAARAFTELASNPEMAAQVRHYLANPAAMNITPEQQRQVITMMRNRGMFNAGGGAVHPALSSISTARPSNNNNRNTDNTAPQPPRPPSGNTGNGDADQTEEEMIAEAIRRSLQDGNNGP